MSFHILPWQDTFYFSNIKNGGQTVQCIRLISRPRRGVKRAVKEVENKKDKGIERRRYETVKMYVGQTGSMKASRAWHTIWTSERYNKTNERQGSSWYFTYTAHYKKLLKWVHFIWSERKQADLRISASRGKDRKAVMMDVGLHSERERETNGRCRLRQDKSNIKLALSKNKQQNKMPGRTRQGRDVQAEDTAKEVEEDKEGWEIGNSHQLENCSLEAVSHFHSKRMWFKFRKMFSIKGEKSNKRRTSRNEGNKSDGPF